MKKVWALCLSACMAATPLLASAETAYTDGTYTAVKPGFGGDVTATVSVSDGKIDAVSLVGDKETRGIGSKAIELLPEQIVAAQSAEIDGIAGATVSSTAALSAVQAALDEAADKDTATVKMAPGTYTIQKYGFQQIEPVTVTMTVDEDRILSVELDGNKDSVAMVRSVKNLLIPRIIANQSYAVDAITGATSTSNAVLTGVRDMLVDALVAGGSDESALAAFESRESKSDISETVDVDVLVVGLGASGTAAVLAAAEAQQDAGQPVSVLGIDTAGRWGGTGAFTGSIMGVNAKGFKEKLNNGQDYMDGEDLYNTWLEYTEGDAKHEIIKKFLDNSGDTVDWLADEHGMLLNEPIAYFGSKWACVYDYVSRNTYKADRDYNDDYQGTEAIDGQNTMVDKYYQRLYNDFEAMGGKIMLETTGYGLIYDKEANKVTGVLAEGHDGTKYTINAKSVILATGGYGGSDELNVKYLSENPYWKHLGDDTWQMIGMEQNTGLMIVAATDIGAGTFHIDTPPMVHFAGTNIVLHDYPVNTFDDGSINLWYGWDFTWSKNDVPTALALTSTSPWVNADGERFEPEGAMFGWWKAGPSYWAVYSQNLIDDIAANGFPAKISTYANATQGGMAAGVPVPEMQDILDKLAASGQICKADTLEELAAQMGVDKDTFVKTIDDYNGFCKAGEDTQYGKAPEKLLELTGGPYYAIKCYSHSFCSCGGLDINEDMQVLAADGETVIGNLYAVGNDSCGVLYTDKKPYVTYGGAALGWAYTSGRLAGGYAVQNAAQ